MQWEIYIKWFQSIRFHWRFQRQASIVSSFRWFTAVTTDQKRQDDWKSLRNLSKHSFRIIFLHSSHRETIRKQRFRSFYSLKARTSIHSQKLIKRWSQSKHVIFNSHRCNAMTEKRQKHTIEKLHECNTTTWTNLFLTIQSRKDAISFKFKTIKNSHLTKLTESQSKYIVSLTFRSRELSM